MVTKDDMSRDHFKTKHTDCSMNQIIFLMILNSLYALQTNITQVTNRLFKKMKWKHLHASATETALVSALFSLVLLNLCCDFSYKDYGSIFKGVIWNPIQISSSILS